MTNVSLKQDPDALVVLQENKYYYGSNNRFIFIFLVTYIEYNEFLI